MSVARSVVATFAVLVAAALVLAGCGVGAGEGPKGVDLRVTDDFGGRTVGEARAEKAPGGETVMRYLQREFKVDTEYSGGFVQSIDGLAGQGRDGSLDWFFYVNGIESSQGAASVKLNPGDRVWWDRHDWSATMRIPAVVGSFPEPFVSGSGGKRFPVRVECAPGADAACRTVRRRLTAAGANPAGAALGGTAGRDLLRVVVGPWAAIDQDPAAGLIGDGPQESGVYARFGAGGRALELLDAAGRPARRLGAGAGLVAATRVGEQQPTWAVTGTDAAGVAAAASALTQRTLRDRFAVALAPGQASAGVPITGPAR